MQQGLSGLLGILTIGAIGAIVYTLVTNPNGVNALFTGTDNLLKSSYAASLGKVA
jgi:hypothetical protein